VSGFDPIKALKEEIAGVGDIVTTLTHRKRNLAQKYGELEVELNQVTKLHGFAVAEMERKRQVLKQLEEQ
jgi:hypothetical protein